jgi:GAF domain-containing protein
MLVRERKMGSAPGRQGVPERPVGRIRKGGLMPQQLPLDQLTLSLARIKNLLLTEEKVDHAVQLLAEGIRDSFDGSAGAGVSLMDEQGSRTSAGATDAVVLEADAAQYELGQGPCLTAWATERTLLIQDVATDDRWPLWSQAVRHLSIRSVISTPLMVGPRCLGALKIYATVPGAFDAATARPLEKLAAPAATLLDNIQTSEAPQRITQALTSALHSRDTVNRAQGILMQKDGLGASEALRELVRLSKAGRRSLLSVSTDIVGGTKNTPHEGS